jgi:hypothetical protein
MMDLLIIALLVGFVWWLTKLPRVIRETKQEFKDLNTLN